MLPLPIMAAAPQPANLHPACCFCFCCSVEPDTAVFLKCCCCCCCCCSYRTSVEEVPVSEYTIPLGKAQLLREGSDITLIGWGAQVCDS
jgi:hypothetical protein